MNELVTNMVDTRLKNHWYNVVKDWSLMVRVLSVADPKGIVRSWPPCIQFGY